MKPSACCCCWWIAWRVLTICQIVTEEVRRLFRDQSRVRLAARNFDTETMITRAVCHGHDRQFDLFAGTDSRNHLKEYLARYYLCDGA